MKHQFSVTGQAVRLILVLTCVLSFSGTAFASGSIRGTVHNGDAGYGNEYVYLYSSSGDAWSYTPIDNNGDYIFYGLPDGDYYVSVYYYDENIEGSLYYSIPPREQAGVYTPTYSTFCAETATAVTIGGSAAVSNINIIVNMTGYLSGNVFSDDKPSEGVEVWAWSDDICYGKWTVSDSAGYFMIPDLYKLSQTDGASVGYRLYAIQGNFITESEQKIGTDISLIGFEVKSGGTLTVFVYDGARIPVTNASVSIWSANAGFAGVKGVHKGEGIYEFYNCPPVNDYKFSVSAPGYPVRDYSFEWITYNAIMDINLASGTETFSGFITPLAAGVSVFLWSETTGADEMTYTDAEGKYQFTALFPGDDYQVMVFHPNYPPYYEANIKIPGSKDIDMATGCQGAFSITGTVSGYGYGNIVVEAWSSSGIWNSAKTDENGQYVISCLPPGVYTVSVTDYYFPQWKTVTIVRQNVQADFFAGGQEMFSISGTVSNLAKDEIAWVNARSLSSWMGNSVEIRGTGEQALPYRISELYPMSDYVVEIMTSEYYMVYDGKSDWVFADEVNLTAGSKENIDFTLPPQEERSGISGVVKFPAGALKGDSVWVSAYSMSQWVGKEKEVILNQDAAALTEAPYEIPGLLPAEDYVVSVWSDKYMNRYYNGNENGTSDWYQAVWVDAKNVRTVTGIDFLLSAGETVKGRVEGSGNAYLHVEAWSNSSGSWGETLTDANGNFTVGGLEPGTDYIVSAWDPNAGFVYYKTDAAVVWDWTQAAHVSTGAENVVIRLSEGGVISGIVRSSAGQPLKDIWVSALSDAAYVGNGAYSDENGKYEIHGLPQGAAYDVTAEPQWYMTYLPQRKTGISSPQDKADFYLSIKDSVFTITGTVTDTLGSPVANADIEIWSFRSGYGKAKTNKDGVYTITGLTGGADYTLEATPPADSGLAYDNRKVNVPNDNYLFQLQAAKSFTGTASDKTGAKLKEVRVTAYSFSKNFWKQELTNAKGEYQITGAPDASDYLMMAEKIGYVTQEKYNQTPGQADFILESAGNISGTIVEPISGKLAPIQNAKVEAKLGETVAAAATTDEKGKYVLKNLPEYDAQGNVITNYSITASHGSYPSKTKSPHKAGDTVDFQLEKGSFSEITGRVVNFDGSSVSDASVIVEAFTKAGTGQKFEKSAAANEAGVFVLPGLSSAAEYYLKIQAWTGAADNPTLDQWIGDDMTGIDNDTAGAVPAGAKMFKTISSNDIVVKFSRQAVRSIANAVLTDIPGPVTNLRSATHGSVLIAPSPSARTVSNVNSGALGKVSNNPYVTVTWEPTSPNTDEGYYTVFNQENQYLITKRNAPSETPQRTRTVTSPPLTGDDVQYYFHIAAVDNRGTIGQTSSIGFRIDTVPPKNGIVRAKTNDSTETTRNITLELGASGAYEVYISSTSYGENGKWDDFSVMRQWKLPETGDTQKVYVQYRDQAGNTSNAVTTVNFNSLTEKDSLENAVRALQIVSGMQLRDAYSGTDVFGDNRVNLHEVIFILQKASKLRE